MTRTPPDEGKTTVGTYHFGPDHPDETYTTHQFPEHICDIGEVRLNFAVAGSDDKPALLLIPGQSESWWGYEGAMPLLAQHFHTYAVDMRGQGRSSRTPGRYTLDNMATTWSGSSQPRSLLFRDQRER